MIKAEEALGKDVKIADSGVRQPGYKASVN